MRIVKNWRDVHKHISTLSMGAFLSLCGIYNMMPPQLQNAFTPKELKIGAFVLITIGFLGKYVDQSNHDDHQS